MALVMHSAAKQHAVATWDGTLVVGIWRRTPDFSSVRVYRAVGREAGKTHPSGIFFLTIADNPGSPPDGPTRREYATMMNELEGVTVASAITTLGGSSLGLSLVRGVVTSVLMLARHKTPTRMLAGLDESIQWLAQEGTARGVRFPDVVTVKQVVTQLQGAMDKGL